MKENKAVILLFLASFIWGVAFIFQRTAAGVIGPCYFNALRMMLGCIVLLPLCLKSAKAHSFNREYLKTLLKGGIVCGIATALPSLLQQKGIEFTTAGKAGFITSTYMLFVPIISVFMRKKISKKVWICVFCGLIGAYLLSINGETGINKGDLLIFLCALLFAFQMIFIEHFAAKLDGPDLSTMQFFFSSITCFIIGLFTESFEISQLAETYGSIIYTGIFSCGIAYTLQIVGQKYVSVEKATLPLSLENAWAAVAGAAVLNETMTVRELIGCVILFTSVIISQLPDKSGKSN